VFQSAGFESQPQPPEPREAAGARTPGHHGSVLWGIGRGRFASRINFVTTGSDHHLVRCDAYRVLEKGSRHFEEEHKLSSMKAGPYQELLDKVKLKVEATTPTGASP
jgi:hypothetical protein